MKVSKTGKDKIGLKVMDFTIWNGVKFGFGFMIGSALFSLCLFAIAFILRWYLIGMTHI